MDEPQLDNGLLTPAEPANPVAFFQWATSGNNLVIGLKPEEIGPIARQAIEDYRLDKSSMADWLTQMQRGIDLARLVKETKDYPHDKAANVKYPLITSAALQFNARAYPAIVADDRVVKAKVWGKDQSGEKAARADRVSEFMSYQLSASIPEWETETDKLLTMLPIVGTMFRKWWHDPMENRPRCRLIEPGKFMVNAKVKALEDAPRVTEEIPLFPVEIESRIRGQLFEPFEYVEEGADTQAPQDFIEQHCRYDLDGDGYPEPYIVTVHVATEKLVRMVADYGPGDVILSQEGKVVRINRGSYFVAYQFMPGMEGSFWGTGLGLLLGDISETINTLFNMLIDAGHYASLGGGFIGSELRMKGGAQRMRPGEWRLLNGLGSDARQALVPLTYPGPDATMFQMLGMLTESGREIASVKDIMTGDAPRNQTATTTMAMIEQGMMVFTAAYKRIFNALKSEYKLLAAMNAATLSPEIYSQFHDMPADPQADFGAADMDIEPIADPRSVTKMQAMAKAQMIMQLAEQGLVDTGEALARIAQAADIPDAEALMPKPDPMQQQMAQMQSDVMRAQVLQAQVNIELTLAQIESERAGAMKNLADAQSKEFGIRLDTLRTQLEDERNRMGLVLKGIAGMAGKPGNGNPAASNGQGIGSPQGGPGAIIPFGPPGTGGGQTGFALGGAMG